MRNFSLVARLAALCLLVCSVPPQAFARRVAGTERPADAHVEAYRDSLLTPDEERAVGRRLAYLYAQRHTPSKSGAAQTRINRVLARLALVLGATPLDVVIIKSSEPEAVSFPPGRLFVTDALLELAQSDDELAAIIAHEAAHVRERHLVHLIGLALRLSVSEREEFPTRAAIVTGQAAQFSFPRALAGARLGCEMEADKLAAFWLERAGYQSTALSALLEGLKTRLSLQAQPERESLYARIASLNSQYGIQ